MATTQLLLQQLLLTSAQRWPDRLALVCGKARLSYAEIVQRASSLARSLQAAGVARGERVLVYAHNSVDAVVAFWGVLMADAVACPVHPGTPAAKLAWYLADTRATGLICDESLLTNVIEAATGASHLRSVTLSADEYPPEASNLPGGRLFPKAQNGPCVPPITLNEQGDLAAILYTSGSTGVPKGAMLSHGNMLAAADAIQSYLGYRQDDKVLAALPMSFDYGLYQIILAFAAGASVLLERSFGLMQQVVRHIARERVTVFPGMPTVFALLFQIKHWAGLDLSAVRLVTSTGAPLEHARILWLREVFAAAEIYSMYGLTECKRCTYLPSADIDRKPGSVGIAMPGLRMWVVDARGHQLPVGEVGELVVQGPTVMQGYWGDALATAERLKPGAEGIVLHTGDLCRLDAEGYLYIVGRMDDMIIKSRGERVAPREIEIALLGVAGVREACVLGIPDDVQGQAIKAIVVLCEGADLDELALRVALRNRIDQRLIPSIFEFRDVLPLGPTGKVDRARLG